METSPVSYWRRTALLMVMASLVGLTPCDSYAADDRTTAALLLLPPGFLGFEFLSPLVAAGARAGVNPFMNYVN